MCVVVELIGDDGLRAVANVYVLHDLLMRPLELVDRLYGCTAASLRLQCQPHVSLSGIVVFAKVGEAAARKLREGHVQRGCLCETLSVDTLIYRWTAEALLGQQPPFETVLRGHKLDLVCDAIRASHDRPLNLTEMEQIAGLSARGLQYAFMSRFGCTPMEWQRQERMLFARQRVINATAQESLTDIAFSMGFSSLAAFSALYRKHFGESPSQTLAQR